jgi:hypothetical protein
VSLFTPFPSYLVYYFLPVFLNLCSVAGYRDRYYITFTYQLKRYLRFPLREAAIGKEHPSLHRLIITDAHYVYGQE